MPRQSDIQVSIDASLFEWPSEKPYLRGSECRTCGTVTFPVQDSCPRCCGADVAIRALGTHGTLWTWTTQEFPPKSPPYGREGSSTTFQPYYVGYVELPGELRIEARLAVDDPSLLRIGMPMKLGFETFTRDAEGRDVVIFVFRPASLG